jgi:ABC-2 type transport system ATP-binding protein
MNVIETRGLTRRFARRDAVSGLDLTVPKGAVCALLGPNGAGKTTTIKLLLGLLRPSAGEARVLGVEAERLDAATRGRIGYVAENLDLPEWMSVRRYLRYCRALHPTWDAALEASLLARFELPAGRPLRRLSRGMRMKAMLLSSLAYRPELLVLDEPFGGLDPAVRDDLVRGVFEASGEGGWSVLVSSHDIHELERFADHVAILQEGRLILSESLESLQTRHRRVDLTLAAEPSPAASTAEAARAGGGPTARAPAWPEHWRQPEQAGRVLRLVDTAYVEGESERAYAAFFPGATPTLGPLDLREIYLVSTAAARRDQPQAFVP